MSRYFDAVKQIKKLRCITCYGSGTIEGITKDDKLVLDECPDCEGIGFIKGIHSIRIGIYDEKDTEMGQRLKDDGYAKGSFEG